MKNFAYFITPHGFGHAARASAVMEALLDLQHDLYFHIYTTVPAWFFEKSIPGHFSIHPLLTDIGVVQNGPLQEDLDQTLSRLAEVYPVKPETANQVAKDLVQNECRLVLCDISAVGLVAARAAGIPSILIENFTWDWIYDAYAVEKPGFTQYSRYLHDQYSQAAAHIQTEPFCDRDSGASLTVPPVSRKNKQSRLETRSQLGLSLDKKMILVTLGGIQTEFFFLKQLQAIPEIVFLIPGASSQPVKDGNLVLLPHQNQFYHPDLILASDGVIAKIGYSTIAETYYSGLPIAYIPRPGFRESQPLEKYIQANFSALPISIDHYHSGDWTGIIHHLLTLPTRPHREINGACQIAQFVLSYW